MQVVESLDARVLGEFGGELRGFRLTVPWLEKVERDCDAGPAVIVGELARAVQLLEARKDNDISNLTLFAAGLGAWKVSYIRAPIFWGLQGAGMSPNDAGRLCREFIDERGFFGLLECAELAFSIVTGASSGPKDDPVGESVGAAKAVPQKTRGRRSQTAAPATASSTKRRARSAGAQAT